jgi:hypothetical protein
LEEQARTGVLRDVRWESLPNGTIEEATTFSTVDVCSATQEKS